MLASILAQFELKSLHISFVLYTAGITCGIYLLLKSRERRWENFSAKAAKKDGCEDPPQLLYNWPLALDLVVRAFRADRAGEILHLFVALIHSAGDTFEQNVLGVRGIDTIDPENIEAILSTQFHEFGLGIRSKNFQPLLGHGIFTQDGRDWKTSRDFLRPQFMHNRSENFSVIREETEEVLISLSKLEDNSLDLQPYFFRLTLRTTMAMMVGRSYLIAHGATSETNFANAFNEAQHYLARRGRLGNLYWLLGGSSFRSACKTVHVYIDGIVRSALADELAGATGGADINRYVFLRALMQHTKDPIVLRDHLLNILLAGRDTTACLLSWTIRLLARHPKVQARLRQECIELSSFSSGSLPTKDELKKMSYLENILREVLRLYPSVPVNVRTALRNTTLPRGGGIDGRSPIFVRKGEDVGYCVYAMHRSDKLYGLDANQFRPERWLNGSNTQTDAGDVGWGYLPFNGGPRICLGREFALLEASYVIVRLMQKYQSIELVEEVDMTSTVEKQSLTLVLSSANGCKVTLKSAENQ